MKAIDLLAGTGAFSLGMRNAGMKVVYALDMEKTSKAIYDLNFNHELTLADLNDVEIKSIPEFDILTGGFPCQPFSLAGRRLGFQDDRSDVFWTIVNILDNHKPRFFVLENVKNLISHDNGITFKQILQALKEVGYHVKHKVLNTHEITGIPHHRERVFIVGFKQVEDYSRFLFDFETIPNQPIQTFLEESVPDKYYYKESSAIYPKLAEAVIDENTFYQYRRTYVRENAKGLCPTLVKSMGTGGHNVPIILDKKGIRKLTPRECFNLQGFPRDYVLPKLADSHLYALAGNAITVSIGEMILRKLTI